MARGDPETRATGNREATDISWNAVTLAGPVSAEGPPGTIRMPAQ
ncbi:hypothetical protein [Mesorhizobium sp. B2-3-4]|nr:hypothetical protein [Mesorhizobium sp. B2-3-4]